MTISSQEFLPAPWSLLLSQKQQFLNNHLARVAVTPNQPGKHEMRDEKLSSVGSQENLDTSGYQVSADLDDVDFYWENIQLDVDAVFRAGIDSPFSPTAFVDLEMGGSSRKLRFCSTRRKTRRILLSLQQHQSLRDQINALHC